MFFMRNLLIITAVILTALIFTSCGQNTDFPFSQDEVPSSSTGLLSTDEERERFLAGLNLNSAPVEDLTDLDAVSIVYVKPLVATGGIFSYSWETASAIAPDDLLNVLCYNNLLDLPTDNEGVYVPGSDTPPASQVESALQKHFDVSGDYLKTSTRYNANSDTYQMVGGFGGGGGAIAIGAKQTENQVTIRIALLQFRDDTTKDIKSVVPEGRLKLTDNMLLTAKGTLKLELITGTTVKYISYQLDDGVAW